MNNHIDMEDSQKTNDLGSLMDVQDNNFMFGSQEENASANNQDVEMNDPDDEDRARSEVRFNFKVENISNLKDTALSPPHYARNLPWKIMVMPRNNPSVPMDRSQKCLGFFLQCNGETESSAWSCYASAELTLIPQKAGIESFSRRIQHLFFIKENDWGFSHFMTFNDLLDPDKGFIKDDSIILEVHVTADAPHGVSWDSKKHTGYVGLKNQGATCYMNSLLQTLYFTNQLRKAVYKMPTESDDSNKSVALALQRVFHELQFSDKPVGTKKLTKSFGWETLDSFMQHDVQEFLRVLLDKLEIKMKGTCVEGTVPKLFEGKMISFIKCKKVNYTSSRAETFYDIQLNVKGKKDILESFKDYIEPEVLEGDNKYDAGEHGLQDAEKGVTFENLPPVLHLHLMRFQYDPVTDCSVKFNDRFEFYERIELDDFLKEKGPTPATYILHAVLVHSGDNHGGHYVVYINPKGDNKWCKFDDDVVSKCSKDEAVAHNFGGNDEDSGLTVKLSTNAYMLVYIRESELVNVLEDVTEKDIPQELEDRLKEEKNLETIKRKERNEAHLYMNVNVFLEDMFEGYQGADLCDPDKCIPRLFKVRKNMTLDKLAEEIAKTLGYPVEQIRLWPLQTRQNGTIRPSYLDVEFNAAKSVIDASTQSPWPVFVETLSPEEGGEGKKPTALPPFDKDGEVLFFFKLYEPKRQQMCYLGHAYLHMTESMEKIQELVNSRAGQPLSTRLLPYEEITGTSVRAIHPGARTLHTALENIMDGDILIFQRDEDTTDLELPTVKDYFADLATRVEVTFCDKTILNDQGFTLEVSLKMTYDQMVALVAQHLNTDKKLIQMFKVQAYKDTPGGALPHNYEGTLKDILAINNKSKTPKKIHYQKLSIPVVELINKRPFKISWLGPKQKEDKDITMYVHKDSAVGQFLEEAKKDPAIAPELLGPDNGGSGLLRLLEISNQKISADLEHSISMDQLFQSNATTKIHRLEEIPADEVSLDVDELLIPVAHFQKDIHNIFGYPFLLRIKDNERFSKVKERLAKKLNIQEKEFEKYKFGVINNNRVTYIEDDSDCPVSINQFRTNVSHQDYKVWLGLDHINKAPKRSRLNYLEKAIKIYN
uniref:Ubiquitin carboxyl-terminal hydrolase 7 n=2 Tax=Cacopsylla melanoneura TaxID=428564 RepID=A0A8D8Y3K7_9HEMI